MGLAAHGHPYPHQRFLTLDAGLPRIDTTVLHREVLRRHPVFHTDQLPMIATDTLPGFPPRRLPGAPLTTDHADTAATTQAVIDGDVVCRAAAPSRLRVARPPARRACEIQAPPSQTVL